MDGLEGREGVASCPFPAINRRKFLASPRGFLLDPREDEGNGLSRFSECLRSSLVCVLN